MTAKPSEAEKAYTDSELEAIQSKAYDEGYSHAMITAEHWERNAFEAGRKDGKFDLGDGVFGETTNYEYADFEDYKKRGGLRNDTKFISII